MGGRITAITIYFLKITKSFSKISAKIDGLILFLSAFTHE